MPQSLRIVPILAALLALFAFAGCGDDEPDTPGGPPTPSVGVTATGSEPGPSDANGGANPTADEEGMPKLSGDTKAFVAKVDKICRKYDTSEVEVYYADALASGESTAADLKEMRSNYRKLVRAAEALNPPAPTKAKFDAYVTSVRELIKESGPLTQALARRTQTAIMLGAENCIMDSAD